MNDKVQASAKEFDGMASSFRESPWLASEDLLGLGDIELTINLIEEHRNVEFDKGRMKERLLVIGFEGKQRKLVLNGTNRKKLIGYFGNKVSGWKGQKIVLYVEKGIRVGKEVKNGLRIK